MLKIFEFTINLNLSALALVNAYWVTKRARIHRAFGCSLVCGFLNYYKTTESNVFLYGFLVMSQHNSGHRLSIQIIYAKLKIFCTDNNIKTCSNSSCNNIG